jgi:hypothetical protein
MTKERYSEQLLGLLKSEEDTVKIYSEKELQIISHFAGKLQDLSHQIGESELSWWIRLPVGNKPDADRFNGWKKEFVELKKDADLPNLDSQVSLGFSFFLSLCDSARIHFNDKK